jgi:hypothetical protein
MEPFTMMVRYHLVIPRNLAMHITGIHASPSGL